jgi:hypothetical protein
MPLLISLPNCSNLLEQQSSLAVLSQPRWRSSAMVRAHENGDRLILVTVPTLDVASCSDLLESPARSLRVDGQYGPCIRRCADQPRLDAHARVRAPGSVLTPSLLAPWYAQAYWPNSESSVPIVRRKAAPLLMRPTLEAGECPSMLLRTTHRDCAHRLWQAR